MSFFTKSGCTSKISDNLLINKRNFFIYFLVDSGYENLQSPATPLTSQFRFSPGQHAEQLKLLKQSPGAGYFREGRPMFQNTGNTVNLYIYNSFLIFSGHKIKLYNSKELYFEQI